MLYIFIKVSHHALLILIGITYKEDLYDLFQRITIYKINKTKCTIYYI